MVTPTRGERGSVLVLTLVLLIVVGLVATASMRLSVSSERVVNNLRLEALALQYAELGLRYCESQLQRPPISRELSLQNLEDLPSVATADVIWNQEATWSEQGSSVVLVPQAQIAQAHSTFSPPRPQCLVEKVEWTPTEEIFLVTARGFSPGYRRDASGRTTAGAVVWLQSTLALD